jgi:hypothetical protein
VPHESLDQGRASYTPAAACPVNQVPDKLIPGDRNAPGFDDTSMVNDASTEVQKIRLPDPHLLGVFPDTLTPTLTTTALYRSSLEWFEACS